VRADPREQIPARLHLTYGSAVTDPVGSALIGYGYNASLSWIV
jgi:hypothetical protein